MKYLIAALMLAVVYPAFAYNEGLGGPAAGTHGTDKGPSGAQSSQPGGGRNNLPSLVGKCKGSCASAPDYKSAKDKNQAKVKKGKAKPKHPKDWSFGGQDTRDDRLQNDRSGGSVGDRSDSTHSGNPGRNGLSKTE